MRPKEHVNWHELSVEAVADKVRADPIKGLTSAEAAKRLEENGPNVLSAPPKKTIWQVRGHGAVAVPAGGIFSCPACASRAALSAACS